MKPEIREQVISALLSSFVAIGASGFDEAMQKLERATAGFLEAIRSLQTVDQLRQILDAMDTTEEQEKMMLGTFTSASQLVAMFVAMLGQTSKATLPKPAAGRPAVDYFTRERVLDFIMSKMRAGCSLKQAKVRATMQFDLSGGTVQRIWNERGAGNLPNTSDLFEAMQNGTIPLALDPAKAEKP